TLARVDNFIRSYAPKAAEQLVSMSERMSEGSLESYSQALTTCRRLLLTVADAIFPARSEPYIDGGKKKRDVGPENYKNRLMAYLEVKRLSSGTEELIRSDLEHLAA
ncbi:hypothetical protein PQJ75_23655, partial [Rhodoplanes sp. TEM]|nr:hypothetical protein [Rhodoplanes tepidamans]MDC7986736.1 hypothetical protein [Rhodoplanes sp. TEM]